LNSDAILKIADILSKLYEKGEPSKREVASALMQVGESVRSECMQIAAEEFAYWRKVGDSPDRSHDLEKIAMGAVGASSNIVSSLFQNKSLQEVKTEMAQRDKNR